MDSYLQGPKGEELNYGGSVRIMYNARTTLSRAETSALTLVRAQVPIATITMVLRNKPELASLGLRAQQVDL